MSIQELVRRLPRDKRALLCELLIEIILESKKNGLPNELALNILALWTKNQLITINKTLSLIQTSYEVDPETTQILMVKMGLASFSEIIEVEAVRG
jgi:hypothetical protein